MKENSYSSPTSYETFSFLKFNSALFNCNARSHIRLTHAHIDFTLAFAHTSMHVLTHIHVHSRTTIAHSLLCSHTHRERNRPYVHARAYAHSSEYKFMHMHTQSHTRACIYAQSVAYLHSHTTWQACTLAMHTGAHAVVHSHSWMHICARPLVNRLEHVYSCMHTLAGTCVHAHSSTHSSTHTHAHSPAKYRLYSTQNII